MGIMQAEFQEKRQWVPKERFVEGLFGRTWCLGRRLPSSASSSGMCVAVVILIGTLIAILVWRIGALKLRG